MDCPKCGTQLKENSLVCDNCGENLSGDTSLPTSLFGRQSPELEASQTKDPDDKKETSPGQLNPFTSIAVTNRSLLMKNRFDLQEIVEQDTLGTTYKAFDKELNSEVLLKLFHEHLGRDPLVRKLFSIELKALRRLSHPGIVTGFEIYEEENEFYFTTKVPIGERLDKFLARRSIDLDLAKILFRQLMEIVISMHACGVLHRDIKPSVLYVDQDNHLMLTGFSHVRLNDMATVTMRSQMVSSPAYKAPELLRGEPATSASDIYAAGLVLYEMIAGSPLFDEETIVDQLKAKSRIIVDWADRLNMEADRDDGAGWLISILPQLVHPDPTQRLTSGRDVLQALETSPNTQVEEVSPLTVQKSLTLWEQHTCPACQGQMIEAVGLCPECGINGPRLTEWNEGPYLVYANMKYRRDDKGKWRGRGTDTVVQRQKVNMLLEKFYGPLSEREKHSLAQVVIIARQVDKDTADQLIRVFEAHGIRAKKRRTSTWFNKFIGAFLKIPGRRAMGLFFGNSLLGSALIIGLAPTGYGDSLLFQTSFAIFYTIQMCCIFASFRLALLHPKNKLIINRLKQPKPFLTIPDSIVEAYKAIDDQQIRYTSRKLLAETRALIDDISTSKALTSDSYSDEYRQEQVRVIEQLELSSMRLFASLPGDFSEQEGEILHQLQKLEANISEVPEEEKKHYSKNKKALLSSLSELKEAEAYRIRVLEEISSAEERLRALHKDFISSSDKQVNEEAQKVLDDILSLGAGTTHDE
ncbi:protein kinase [candidate division CSSED10-310 bacterium]|uniref:Protein kinase n=1 Tax=candidate division CSSED10-310 bacterium TaxID=2855610 RepID=A0ABV6YUA0_UNCC1